MVLRNLFAVDNENLVVSVSPGGGLAIGSGIINNSATADGTVFTYTSSGGTTITVDDDGAFADAIPADNNLFFNDDELGDHQITDGGGLVADGTQVEAESLIFLRALDAEGNQTGAVITVTVFSQGGDASDVWGFATDTPLIDGVSYVKTGGSNDGTSLYSDFITCFGPETSVLTASGYRDAYTLDVGDMVWTLHDGYQPVRWVGRTKVVADGAFAPVVFAPGAIGNEKELIVSQEHRIYMRDTASIVLFGVPDVLIAAKHLCGLPGVALRPCNSISYVHFMFDRHQIIIANGVESESFYLSDHSVSGVEANQKRELLALFPSLEQGIDGFGAAAAMPLKAFEAKVYCNHLRFQSHV